MKDYPYFPCYIAEVLLDTAGMSKPEIADYFLGLIVAWKKMDHSKMPEWLAECADTSISKSRRLSENAKIRWEASKQKQCKSNAKAMQLHSKCNAEEKRGEEKRGEEMDKSRPQSDIEVLEYFIDRGLSKNIAEIEAEKFLNHYEKVGWVSGKNRVPIKNWKACVRTWMGNIK